MKHPSVPPIRALVTTFVVALVVGVVVAGAPGCLLLYAFNADPEGLPCANIDAVRRTGDCLDGYVCVFREEAGEERAVCLRISAKGVDEVCTIDDECRDDLVCGAAFETCLEGSDDVNCTLADALAKERRCRPACDIARVNDCPTGLRCFEILDEDASGLCQEGTCASDADCTTVGGLCAGRQGQGKTGLCLERCDPLTCVSGACGGCDGIDGEPDPAQGCEPVPGEAVSDRNVCLPAGTAAPFEECGPRNGAVCARGSFCAGDGICTPWCRVGGGNPECDGGATCTPIVGALGFCLP